MDQPFENALRNVTRFSLSMFRNCETGENLTVSPLSVMAALGMVLAGTDGETKDELLAVLGNGIDEETFHETLTAYLKSLPSSEDAELSFADAVFVNKTMSVERKYVKATESKYNAEIERLVFDEKAVKKINAWVSKKTSGMIPEIIGSVVPEVMMYLINALSFIGKWQTPYKPSDVEEDVFTALSGEEREITAMCSQERIYLHNERCSGFIKPYRDSRYGFLAILPAEDAEFSDFVSELTDEFYLSLLQSAEGRKVAAMIPKFSMDYSTVLNGVLAKMGIEKAFLPGADFSRMTKDRLSIGEVIHKTHIEVDEEGTKAAAVTSVMLKTAGMPEPMPEVFLNRPFVFGIIDTQCMIPLFLGTVTDL